GGGNLRLRARGFNGGERPLVDLVAIVLEQALRGGKRLLFHPQIGVETDQIVVKPDHARDRADHLLLKNVVGNLLAVLRDVDKAAVQFTPEPSQQGLRDSYAERRESVRIEQIAESVLVLKLILKAGRDLRSRAETLQIAEVAREAVRGQIGAVGGESAGLRRIRSSSQQLPGEKGIVQRNIRTACERKGSRDAQIVLRFCNQLSIGDTHGNGRLRRRACGGRGQQRTSARAADARRRFIHGQRDAAQHAAALRAICVGRGHADSVSLQFQIQIVFESESDGVLQGQIELTGADQLANSCAVSEIGTRHGTWTILAAKEAGV